MDGALLGLPLPLSLSWDGRAGIWVKGHVAHMKVTPVGLCLL